MLIFISSSSVLPFLHFFSSFSLFLDNTFSLTITSIHYSRPFSSIIFHFLFISTSTFSSPRLHHCFPHFHRFNPHFHPFVPHFLPLRLIPLSLFSFLPLTPSLPRSHSILTSIFTTTLPLSLYLELQKCLLIPCTFIWRLQSPLKPPELPEVSLYLGI